MAPQIPVVTTEPTRLVSSYDAVTTTSMFKKARRPEATSESDCARPCVGRRLVKLANNGGV